jgi:hypothetical protein
MGLTVHYRLRSAAGTASDVRAQISQLRSRALTLPFAQVGEIIEFTQPIEINASVRDDPAGWLVCQSRHHFEHRGLRYFVTPRHLIAFVTMPGEGCEPFNLGLCQYPSTLLLKADGGRSKRIKTGVRPHEWRWSSFCKTQYASDPRCGGVSNFLKCHLLVTAMLDFAKSRELLEHVDDESDYWENRDVEALAKEVGGWNAMIARIAGELKDQLGDQVVAPITKFPDFEHLEAQGHRAT